MTKLRVCSLFSGIGGFEVGLEQAGLETIMVCDNDVSARVILKKRYPDVFYRKDVTAIKSLPRCDVLTGGWPCQDLSQAGKMAGISGGKSGLISEVFRLIEASKHKPRYVVLENVAFALHLQRGEAIRYVVSQFERLGYNWAYRVLNTREFGLAQRRRRVFIVAARDGDPSNILFDGAAPNAVEISPKNVGFYWTEGNRGIGWTPEAIPPLKGGSGFSIPSPPAIWNRKNHTFFSPGITDAERLQGFKAGWTAQILKIETSDRIRWRLVGNAVSPPIARWLGRRIAAHDSGSLPVIAIPNNIYSKRANMGWGGPGRKPSETHVTVEGPASPTHSSIAEFVFRDNKPLSKRASSGFLERLVESPLIVERAFIVDLARYCGRLDLIADKAA